MAKEILTPGNPDGIGGGIFGSSNSSPHQHLKGHSWAVRARELGGFEAPPRQGWDIKAGSAGACQPGFVSLAPINA